MPDSEKILRMWVSKNKLKLQVPLFQKVFSCFIHLFILMLPKLYKCFLENFVINSWILCLQGAISQIAFHVMLHTPPHFSD